MIKTCKGAFFRCEERLSVRNQKCKKMERKFVDSLPNEPARWRHPNPVWACGFGDWVSSSPLRIRLAAAWGPCVSRSSYPPIDIMNRDGQSGKGDNKGSEVKILTDHDWFPVKEHIEMFWAGNQLFRSINVFFDEEPNHILCSSQC